MLGTPPPPPLNPGGALNVGVVSGVVHPMPELDRILDIYFIPANQLTLFLFLKGYFF